MSNDASNARDLLSEHIPGASVSIMTVLGGATEGYTPYETGIINRQLVTFAKDANSDALTDKQYTNFWAYIDANFDLLDWHYLVGAIAHFNVEGNHTFIDKLLKASIPHCHIIIKALVGDVESHRAAFILQSLEVLMPFVRFTVV